MHEIQRLQQQHLKIVNLALSGLTRSQIAQEISMSPQNVGMVLKSPLVQNELARRRDKLEPRVDQEIATAVTRAKECVEDASENAAKTMVGLMSEESPRVRFSAARDILDRAMGRAQDKTEKPPTLVIDAETINLLQIASQESLS